MAHYYRGSCLSENNKDKAISQTHYYKFKVNWVRRECWLHILFEKGEQRYCDSDGKRSFKKRH